MFDVLTIGTVIRDVFLTSPSFKVLRDKKHLVELGFKTGEAECFALGSKIRVEKPHFTVGGGAYNTAVTFTRQEFKTGSLFKIGNDMEGESIIKSFKKEKITPLPLVDKKNATGHSTILVTPEGERTILVYRGASYDVKKAEIPWRKLKANWVYISPGEIPMSVMSEVVKRMKKQGSQIAINPSKFYLSMKKSVIEPFLNKCDVVIVNREEAAHLTGKPYHKDRAIFKKFDEIVEGVAVVTDGANGAAVSDGSFVYRSGIFKEKRRIDRTGAGDAFGSAFVAGLLRKNDIHYALRLATANATSVVEHIGASTGSLTRRAFSSKRWKYLNLDIESL